ncbi:peptidoglycan-binding protein [Streptomyces sp. NPDC007971]|uniref:peptidoglycan-binding domain-containing protein n=1 Tax=unclassified Streptomyces TaxID=2593676 RepID=UPI0036EA6B9D
MRIRKQFLLLVATAALGSGLAVAPAAQAAVSAPSSGVVAPMVHGCNFTTAQPVLRYGSTGSAVKELQCLLKYWGFNPGAVDGSFGSNTAKAVKQFQAWWPLAVDGVVGPDTWTALKS